MKYIIQFMAIVAALALSIGNSLIVMIYGWGMRPANWWIILGCGIFSQAVMSGVFQRVCKYIDEENKK